MFYSLATALCLAVLFLGLISSLILFLPVMLLARRMARSAATENDANLLFIARLLPLLIAAVITLGMALPSFLEFEPYSSGEGIGPRLDMLAMGGALLLAVMAARMWRIWLVTRRTQRSWLRNAKRIYLDGIKFPVYCVEGPSSLLAVTGIFRAKIFLAREIAETLSLHELKAALEHEIAHITSFDNLKRMLLKVTQPPRWLKTYYDADVEWSGASEIVADNNALARGASVLDLSAALIKVGRLRRISCNTNAIASHLIPAACSFTLEQRITRLGELLQDKAQTPVRTAPSGKLLFAAFLGGAAYIACIHALLPAVHEALELLVR